MPKTKSASQKINKWYHQLATIPWQLSLLLLLLTVLRLPNFFEPYWYGDEAIYLSIGQSLNDGAVLYQDIIDHKTPIIYYLARTDNQFNFRILLYIWMLITTSTWYFLAKKMWQSDWGALLGGIFFVLFTTLPWLEGHIPNGELFVMGFVLAGMWLLWQTKFVERFLNTKAGNSTKSKSYQEPILLILAGSFFSLGVLTKVPALFDFAAALSIAWFTLTNNFRWQKKHLQQWWRLARQTIIASVWLTIGFAIPVLLSIIYFVVLGAGQAYLDYGLLYNFHYAGNWDLGITQAWLAYWFTLPGKLTFLIALLAALSLARKYLTREMQWAIMWFGLTLVASLLSNRPYPHYFLQLVPPVALILAAAIAVLTTKKRSLNIVIIRWALILAVVSFCSSLFVIMKLRFYPAVSYYQQTYKYVTGNTFQADYYQYFNNMMIDNYQAAGLMKNLPGDTMFIWGTNPMLYALSERHPVGRFTVAFHIHDLNVYAETIAALNKELPPVIVVMKNEPIPLPGLNELLHSKYRLIDENDHFFIWQLIDAQ